MREIEIKAKLRDKDKIIEKLKSLGCVFEKSVTQIDVVYVKNTGSLEVFLANGVFLRIRVKNNDKIIFTVKKNIKGLAKIEHETEIASKEEMEQALLLMEYKEAVRVNKSRIITHYDGCEICIDEVENLGSFIEMEKMSEDGDFEKIQEKMFDFFLSLGILPEDRVNKGYDILMIEKDKNK